MNIFVLDSDPHIAALQHCNKHVVKMIVETGQMLSTAHWILWLSKLGKTRDDFKLVRDMKAYLRENVPKDNQPTWNMTHQNHQCSIWVRETIANYFWTVRLMRSLLDQYTKRYKKNHKSEQNYRWLLKNIPPGMPEGCLSQHPVCMKDEYKIYEDDGRINVVKSYKNYYILDKSRLAKWEPHSITPKWFKEGIKERQDG